MAGVVLVAVPILFNAGFTLLAQRFDYPDVLRRPTHEVLFWTGQAAIGSARRAGPCCGIPANSGGAIRR